MEIAMQAIRETVDAGILSKIFSLPAAFVNRQIEIIMWPMEDKAAEGKPEKPPERSKLPRLSRAEIDEMAKNDPVIQSLSGCIKGDWLPPPLTRENVTMNNIRKLRLKERYGV
jgi:hypothetical protein